MHSWNLKRVHRYSNWRNAYANRFVLAEGLHMFRLGAVFMGRTWTRQAFCLLQKELWLHAVVYLFHETRTCTDTIEASTGALEHTVAAPVQRVSRMTSAVVGAGAHTISTPTVTLSHTPTEHVLDISSTTECLCPEPSLQKKRVLTGNGGVIWIGKGLFSRGHEATVTNIGGNLQFHVLGLWVKMAFVNYRVLCVTTKRQV
jgi:hypothetical protein